MKDFGTKHHENCPNNLQIYHLDVKISQTNLNVTRKGVENLVVLVYLGWNLAMTKGGTNKKQSKGQRRDELERKRDDRVRRNALKKERKIKEYREDDQDFASFSNQLEALGLKIKDIPGDGLVLDYKIKIWILKL